MDEVSKVPFAEFFEQGIREVMALNPKGVLLAAVTADGKVLLGCEGCSVGDMALVQQEIMLEVVTTRLNEDAEEEG